LLKTAGLSGLAWLTPVAAALALDAERNQPRRPRSVILLWLDGGPSQLETFDPHPGTKIASASKAIDTCVAGIQLGRGLEQLGEQMDVVSLVRNTVSREGDHERATYNIKTGFRPDPTLVHPAIGAVICHQLPVGNAEIPRHVSILPGPRFGRGGYLGNQYDAFQINEPGAAVPDVQRRVDDERFAQRLRDLAFLDEEFVRGRLPSKNFGRDRQRTAPHTTIDNAVRVMDSEQLKAFDITQEPKSVQAAFGETPFGRGCLAALRLIEVGVRCIEITLSGWDSHLNNHEIHDERKRTLDPAFASLLRELRQRELLDETIVLCGGEFGRTPNVNPAGGRDHWPHGFSVALAGGGIRGGYVHGETDPQGNRIPYEKGTPIHDIHATILSALGIHFETMLDTPVGRPIAISEGNVIRELLG
jgi:hypothetical protein